MENEEVKELIGTAHGHELRGRDAGGRDGVGQREIKVRKYGQLY